MQAFQIDANLPAARPLRSEADSPWLAKRLYSARLTEPNQRSRRRVGGLILGKLLARDLVFLHISEFQDEVDDLVLEDRRSQLRQCPWIVAVVVPDLVLLSRELRGPLAHGLADLV